MVPHKDILAAAHPPNSLFKALWGTASGQEDHLGLTETLTSWPTWVRVDSRTILSSAGDIKLAPRARSRLALEDADFVGDEAARLRGEGIDLQVGLARI